MTSATQAPSDFCLDHCIIRASAGAGKTYALTTRYIKLLRLGVEPREILATTFTRKAAGQILGRALHRLAKAAQSADAAKDLAQALDDPTFTQRSALALLSLLCNQLHRVSVLTLDSFFNRIGRAFALEMQIPPGAAFVADDDPHAIALRREALTAVLTQENIHTLLMLLQQLHHDQAKRDVLTALDDIVKDLYAVYRAAPEHELWRSLHVPPQLAPREIDAAMIMLEQLRDQLEAADAGKPILNALRKAISLLRDMDWKGFVQETLTAAVGTTNVFSRKDLPKDIIDCYQPLKAHARAVCLERIAQQTQAMWQLLWRFDQHYTRLRHETGTLLFSDMPWKIAQLMHDEPERMLDVYYRLDTQIKHLLLDEFQDTSQMQWQILAPVAEEICAHADGSRSFFCVGDLKQAIYGWRGGCAAIFDHVENQLQLSDQHRQSLNVSYRSSQVVLDCVNKVFSSLDDNSTLAGDYLAVATKWQQGFEPHRAHFDLPGHVLLQTTAATDEEESPTADDVTRQHVRCVAQHIADLCKQAPGASIGVLTSTNTFIHALLYELRLLNVSSVSGEGDAIIVDDPAVETILSALTLADHPGHTAAAFHVVHSPLGKIVGLRTMDARHLEQASLRIRGDLAARGYANVITDWAAQLSPACDMRSARRLMQLIELAESYDAGSTLRPSDFVLFVEGCKRNEQAPAQVRIMTVHGSKGLEFDCVILPQLSRKLDQDDPAVSVRRASELGEVLGVYAKTDKHVRPLDDALVEAHRQELARSFTDDLSTLYVAMTRAKHALHMFLKPRTPTKSGLKKRAFSFGSILCGVFGHDESVEGNELLYESGDAQWMTQFLDVTPTPPPAMRPVATVARTTEGSRRNWQEMTPSRLGHGGRVSAQDLLAVTTPVAMQRGSLIHAMFESITFADDPDMPPDEAALLMQAKALCPNMEEDWLISQIEQFYGMLKNAAVHESLRRPADLPDGTTLELWRERAFVVHDGKHLLRGQFDRVVLRRCGGKVVRAELLDFKTDAVSSTNIDALADHYAPQIQAYRRALQVMLDLPPDAVDASLLFVGAGVAKKV